MASVAAGLTGRLADRLSGRIAGSLVFPDQPDFRSVRKLFVGRFDVDDVSPLVVARCETPADVAAAVAAASDAGIPFAVRSGGHSFGEHSSTGGLLIDLGRMDSVQFGADVDVAVVGPGTRIGALAERLADRRRVVPCGWCPTVGVAGAVLGGGYGALGRRYGLGCDHLLAAQVVLADGRIVTADADREPELFWALRGAGGGHFGVVTSLVLRTRPALPITTFRCQWPIGDAAAVIAAWQRWAPAAADDVNAELALLASGDLAAPPLAVLFGVVTGRRAETLALLDEFIGLVGTPAGLVDAVERSALDTTGQHAYLGVPASGHGPTGRPADQPAGLRVSKSGFFDHQLPAVAITELVDHFTADRIAGQYRDLEFVPWGGAHARVPAPATAFVHRSARFMLKHAVQLYPGATNDQRLTASHWLHTSQATVARHDNGHVYPNYPDPDLADWGHAYYGANLHRLRQIKATYDPTNTFHSEQPIN